MNVQTEQFTPDYIVTPGEILEETLEARGIKKKDFAERCGRTAKMISEIIAGKAVITPETALQFERVLGISARLWSNLEAKYRLQLAAKEEEERLENHIDIANKFAPQITYLVKYGFMEKPTTPISKLEGLLKFFGIGSVETFNSWLNAEKVYYRDTKSCKSDKYAIAAWLRCGQIEASRIETHPYNADKFKDALKKIRELTQGDFNTAISQTVQLCANSGVAVTFVPELKGTKINGAARWLNKDKALIQLSGRGKSSDILWFTFFHEAGHILLHGKKEIFVDEDGQEVVEQEKEADTFAQDILIPKKEWKEFTMKWASYPVHTIIDFAKEQNISPAIVAGRLKHHEKGLKLPSYAELNTLMVRLAWDDTQRKFIEKVN